ncbi:MAG: hypothetical protein HFK09_03225 [Clostridia bacterium]|nr:hypothetical protein [Clostridia bacterium]
MSFFKEVAERLGGESIGSYTVINYGGEAVYIEGVKRIVSIDSENMRFACGGIKLALDGENLKVSELGGGCVTVTGKVRSVYEEDSL